MTDREDEAPETAEEFAERFACVLDTFRENGRDGDGTLEAMVAARDTGRYQAGVEAERGRMAFNAVMAPPDLHTLILDTANKVEEVLDAAGEEGPLMAQDIIREAFGSVGIRTTPGGG